jgi:hypothetical protein
LDFNELYASTDAGQGDAAMKNQSFDARAGN